MGGRITVMTTLSERFEDKVELIPFSTCHWWNGCQARGGYGQIWIDGKMKLAHRTAYELYVGPIPDDLLALHKCDNPTCVNPDHLFLGTQADNMLDKVEKGRLSDHKGEQNGYSKLTDDDVAEIRSMEGTMAQHEIGSLFGVSQGSVCRIFRRQTWAHI